MPEVEGMAGAMATARRRPRRKRAVPGENLPSQAKLTAMRKRRPSCAALSYRPVRRVAMGHVAVVLSLVDVSLYVTHIIIAYIHIAM